MQYDDILWIVQCEIPPTWDPIKPKKILFPERLSEQTHEIVEVGLRARKPLYTIVIEPPYGFRKQACLAIERMLAAFNNLNVFCHASEIAFVNWGFGWFSIFISAPAATAATAMSILAVQSFQNATDASACRKMLF